MGLFFNNHKHPDVYINHKIQKNNNQEIHRKGFLAELLEEHQNTNASLSQSLDELKEHNMKQEELQSLQWNDLINQLNGFKKRDYEHHNMEKKMMERLQALEEDYQTIHTFLEKEAQLKREFINELLLQNTVREELTKKMEKYDGLAKYMSEQIEKQQQNINEKMSQQEAYQTEILTRLDKQEALTEKLARQINHIRSILFERANFLADKIEDGYKLTSTYVYKLLTGSDKPLSFYTLNHKQKENHNQGN